jgi:hypothetical protein
LWWSAASLGQAVERQGGACRAWIEDEGEMILRVNKVTWKKVGQVKEPDRYNYTFGWLNIIAADLAIWELFPAAFALVLQVGSKDEYQLGSFDLLPPTFELDPRD